ncbi:hypothetical protein L204_105502 [Cryptococcus depauperatus]
MTFDTPQDDKLAKSALQPPFPSAGTSSPPSDFLSQHKQAAENLVNAAAQHIVPSAPNLDTATRTEPAVIDVIHDKPAHQEQGKVREEQPIAQGTPLDEMEPNVQTAEGQLMRFSTVPSPHRQQSSSNNRQTDDADKGALMATFESSNAPQRNKTRPGFGPGRDIGSIWMGASALVSALNALPWEDDDVSDDPDDPDEDIAFGPPQGSASVTHEKKSRPNYLRLNSSLSTIRPISTSPSYNTSSAKALHTTHHTHSLQFPFRQNTIARKARRPGANELSYQFAGIVPDRKTNANDTDYSSDGDIPLPKGFVPRPSDMSSDSGSETSSVTGAKAQIINDRITKGKKIAMSEEREEILLSAEETNLNLDNIAKQAESQSDVNLGAALRDGAERGQHVIEERMQPDESEKRLIRKEKLAQRMMEVFGLEDQEEVLEEMKCWLLRNIMLKGYMYLTRKHICFFARIPNENNLLVKSGPLYKKSSRTKLSTKFWVVLKNDVLSWYESTSDLYFPKGNISLQYCLSCDSVSDQKFKIRTAERSYTFTADMENSRDEWVKALQKVMFKTQHEGECVKLIIPLEAIVDVDKSPTLEFAETIEIKCIDMEDQMSVDSYFFASFANNDYAFKFIQRLVQDRHESAIPRVPSEMTIHAEPETIENSYATIRRPRSGSEKLGNMAQLPFKKFSSVFRPLISHSEDDSPGESTPDSSLLIQRQPAVNSHDDLRAVDIKETTGGQHSGESRIKDIDGYPPRQTGQPPASMQEDSRSWGPSWIRKPASKLFGSSSPGAFITSYPRKSAADSSNTTANTSPKLGGGGTKRSLVTELIEPAFNPEEENSEEEAMGNGQEDPNPTSRDFKTRATRLSWTSESSSSVSQMIKSKSDFSMLGSESGHSENAEVVRRFRSFFALSDKEELIDHFPGYLYRVLPVSGRFFVSTNYFCFRSSQLLYKTKMIIPITDLYGLKSQKAFRFGHSGLVVVIKGHEELFLEFYSSDRRKACISILEERMEVLRSGAESDGPDPRKVEARIMEDLDETIPLEARSPWPVSSTPLFGSATSASFVEFKPDPMRITCLTIGSRGDVQPYIALCKGLQAEGHTCKIATHGEYKEWVEGHGIGFESVGGDPAELMQMCVDNGMFTVSFLKEGLQKFRGWLDDLLNSSWQACQGSDLLIESPSAMSGLHIAEALQIPYYRAFTMPWTRTRAYPHAFAVPEHQRGGSYNYMTYTMFDQIFWRAISGQVNRWRRHVLKLESTNFDKMEQHKVPFLYNFSPTIVPPPLDWTEWIHITGYWFLDKADEKQDEKKWAPPEGLVTFIDKAHEQGRKAVYIGFGSIVVSDPEEMTRCVVKAVVESGVCAILSKGWSDRGTKAKGEPSGNPDGADGVKYPPEIYAIDSIDHGWLFPKIDAACHHGGAGTTGASLRAGIPTIIKPFFGDQAFWAERVESLNVGSAIRKLTSQQLVTALIKATTDDKQIAKARVIGEMIRRENGVARAVEAIYRDLEYAKSVIKPLPSIGDKPLEKVTSLLHPLTTADLSFSRLRTRSCSHSRSSSIKFSPRRTSADDDGWSVVSGGSRSRSGSASLATSPEHRHIGLSSALGRDFLRASLPNPFGRWRNTDEADEE